MAIDPDAYGLVNTLNTILSTFIQGFEEKGVKLPDRRYWTLNQPAADCEQIVVFFNQAYIGPVGDEANEPQRCNAPRTAQIDIQVLRCIPGPTGPRARMPEPEAIQAASELQAIDTWILLDIAAGISCSNDPESLGWGGVIATVDSGEAQGGFQGPTLHLTLAM